MATLGCPGRVSEPARYAGRHVVSRMTTMPSLSIVKAILSPDLGPRRSRISFGAVTWPLVVIVVVSAMSAVLAVLKGKAGYHGFWSSMLGALTAGEAYPRPGAQHRKRSVLRPAQLCPADQVRPAPGKGGQAQPHRRRE